MTRGEASIIRDFSLCDFTAIHQYYKEKSEARKQMTKVEKAKLKAENEQITEEYGWCIIDGHREKIGNFKTEPPGLFRGRGDHPKQGKIKVSELFSLSEIFESVSVAHWYGCGLITSSPPPPTNTF